MQAKSILLPEQQSTIMSWPDLVAWLIQVEREHPGVYRLRTEFMALRSLPEITRDAHHYRPAPDECYTFNGRAFWQTTKASALAWLEAGGGKGNPVPARLAYHLVNTQAPAAEVIQFPARPATPAIEGFVQSVKHPGLWQRVDRQHLTVTFRHGQAEATYSIVTGECLDASDRGNFPPDTWAFIKERVRQLPAPHKRPNEAAAAPDRAAAETGPPQGSTPEPSVSPASAPVNQKEDPMLDLSNPTIVAQARAIATNIKNALGIPDLEARRAELRQKNVTVERVYRKAEVDVEAAKRALTDLKGALRDRGEELINVVAELKAEGTKAKYASASALSTALKAALKTDAAYTGLATELKGLEANFKTAPNDDKPGIEAAIAQKKEALAAREVALNEALAAETVAESTARYTSADAKSAAAITMRKTDAEYLAIKAEVGKAEQALYVAELALADAKAEQRAMVREWEQLRADTDLATARVGAFAGLDAPAPAATNPAPIPTSSPATAAVAS